MSGANIERIVVLGGGTAGWMAAAVLAKALGRDVSVTVVSSGEVGTVGVGEATIPQIRHLHAFLGLDEASVLREANATYKLGIAFEGWRTPGHRYIHAFGELGLPLGLAPFHHYHLRGVALGEEARIWDYSLTAKAAFAERYAPLDRIGDTRLGGIVAAFHLDASRYAAMLRRRAEQDGARHVEGRFEDAERHPQTGAVTALRLSGGRRIEGDLFVDCSGFASLLLGGVEGVPFEDWSDHLPCDSAVVVQSTASAAKRPYTQAMARKAGWQWRIPLQTRCGNGHVYSSGHISDDEAANTLLETLEGEPLTEPRLIRFRTGTRARAWQGNVVGLGLAAGFMEPLESTSIHLVQSAVERLVAAFPSRAMEPALRDAFNRRTRTEWERVRDFLVLHYHVNGRCGEPFWDERRGAAVPESLARRLALFRAGARFFREDDELFAEPGWVQVMLGQGVEPQGWAPAAEALDAGRLRRILTDARTLVARTVQSLPTHQIALQRALGSGASLETV